MNCVAECRRCIERCVGIVLQSVGSAVERCVGIVLQSVGSAVQRCVEIPGVEGRSCRSAT